VLLAAVGYAGALFADDHSVPLGEVTDPAGLGEQEHFPLPYLEAATEDDLARLDGMDAELAPRPPRGRLVLIARHVGTWFNITIDSSLGISLVLK
jgi:hypothetical protein